VIPPLPTQTDREAHAVALALVTWARVRGLYAEMPHLDAEALRAAALYGAALALSHAEQREVRDFTTYAISVIRRTIHTEAREQDFLSRTLRGRAREERRATGEYPAWARRPLELDQPVKRKELISAGEAHVVRWIEMLQARPEIEGVALRHLAASEVRAAVDQLPAREARVVRGLFWRGETLVTLGAEMGVHPTRISQLKAQAFRRLRERLGGQWD